MDPELLNRVAVTLAHYVKLLHHLEAGGFDEAADLKSQVNQVLTDCENLQRTSEAERLTLIVNGKKILQKYPEETDPMHIYWRDLLTKLEAQHV